MTTPNCICSFNCCNDVICTNSSLNVGLPEYTGLIIQPVKEKTLFRTVFSRDLTKKMTLPSWSLKRLIFIFENILIHEINLFGCNLWIKFSKTFCTYFETRDTSKNEKKRWMFVSNLSFLRGSEFPSWVFWNQNGNRNLQLFQSG